MRLCLSSTKQLLQLKNGSSISNLSTFIIKSSNNSSNSNNLNQISRRFSGSDCGGGRRSIIADVSAVNYNRLLFSSILSPTSIHHRTFSNNNNTINCNNMNNIIQKKRVLSIQSHVVHGYVGNKSATFPLQVLGYEVDAINSVQFSNHTGYGHIKGQILNDTELGDLISGLEENKLLDGYSHLLTGYIGKDSFLRKIADTVKKLRKENPNLVYVCDPVMGDNGQLYVPATLLPIYRDEIIPLSNICTPNQFELELITGLKITNEDNTWEAMKWFHDRNVDTVALSSTDLGGNQQLLAFVSHINKSNQNKHEKFIMKIPKQGNGVNFTGTGDLFAGLFLAHSSLNKNVKIAFENTIASLQSVIANTIQQIPEEALRAPKMNSRYRELKIVQSKNDFEHPNVKLYANDLS